MASKRVLVVEDEPLERKALIEMLKSYPLFLELDEASNIPDFERKARQWDPDVVLLDLKIPGGSSLDSLSRLRSEGFHGKVIIVTAYDVFGYAQQAVGLSATAFLVKPIKDGALYEAMNKAMEEIKEADKSSQQLVKLKRFILENKSFVASVMIQGIVRGEEITEGLRPRQVFVGFP
ncbi:MAG TPA: response regulator [Fervidobacterium sp.]|nr:response regulator [Fervidobacterium sp.]